MPAQHYIGDDQAQAQAPDEQVSVGDDGADTPWVFQPREEHQAGEEPRPQQLEFEDDEAPQHDGAPLEAVSEKAPAEVGLQPDGQPDVDEDKTPQFVAPEARPPPWEEQDTPLLPPPRVHQPWPQGLDVLPTPFPTRGSLSPPKPGSNRTSPQASAPVPRIEQTREQHISKRGPR